MRLIVGNLEKNPESASSLNSCCGLLKDANCNIQRIENKGEKKEA
jgi:hypothetical protein